jgi:hypothetical protein
MSYPSFVIPPNPGAVDWDYAFPRTVSGAKLGSAQRWSSRLGPNQQRLLLPLGVIAVARRDLRLIAAEAVNTSPSAKQKPVLGLRRNARVAFAIPTSKDPAASISAGIIL